MQIWDSIEGLTRVQDWLNLTLVLAGTLTALVAIVVYVTNSRLDDLKEARDAEQQRRVDAAESAARDAREQAAAVAQRQAPRQLTNVDAFRQALAGIPKGDVVITAAMNDAESERFARQIHDSLVAAGWTPAGVNLAMWMPTPAGVFVAVQDGRNPPAHAGPLQAALQRAGVSAPGVTVPGTAANAVEIRVGVKPQ